MINHASAGRGRQQSKIILRPRLFALLAELRPVTLVVAPAGYGKTALAESWLQTLDLPRAWLTLEQRHRELARFSTDLATALRPLLPAAALPPPQEQVAAPVLLDGLLAQLHTLRRPAILVLDDCHVLEHSASQAFISRIAQQPPRNLRLVLLTRRDPPLALTSLRAHGLLTEVRTNALRFTAAETTSLLAQLPGAPTDDATVARLLEATEGWITGVLLTFLNLRDQSEAAAALTRLQQGNPHILEYLTGEVLEQEPPAVQEFLLKTAILDRLQPALCATLLDVTGAAQDYLQVLREDNLFIHEAEGDAGWFRYMRLFRQGLLVHLQQRFGPDEIARLHSRASRWFAEAGMIDGALRHALAAGDVQHAIQLVAQRRHDLMNSEEWSTLQRWLDYFDQAAITRSPELSLAEGWLLLNQGRIQELGSLLARIDRMLAADAPLDTATPAAQVGAEAAALRGHLLLVTLQPRAVIAQAYRTIAALPPSWQAARSYVIFGQAAALQMVGDLAQANAVLNDALIWPQSYPSAFHVRVLAAQCQVRWLAADLPGMLRAARQVVFLSEQLHLPQMQRWGAYFVGSIYYLWNELERAAEVLEPVVQQPSASQAIAFANASCALAAVYQMQGRSAAANAIVGAAIDFLRATDRIYLPMLQAFAAELALRQRDIGRAAQLVVQQPAARPDTPAFHFLAPQLVRPKVLLALDQPAARQEAVTLLTQAQAFFAETHNTRFLVETLALLAVAHAADNRRADAVTMLKAALTLAQPGGMVRVFVDIGASLLPLLDMLTLHADAPTLAALIRATIQRESQAAAPQAADLAREARPAATPPLIAHNNAGLAEPLTARELDVLAAMAQHLTSREIADRLGVSTHTIKHHIGNILGKLGVEDRRQAVARARALGLLK
jgi:LuxR family maltose regulon positive regulatory protein